MDWKRVIQFALLGSSDFEQYAILLVRVSIGLFFAISGANKLFVAASRRAIWNSVESRIEMHLESTQEQHVSIEQADLDVHVMRRETIHPENSYKFTEQGIRSLLEEVGFEIRGAWKDSRGWYTLTLACVG